MKPKRHGAAREQQVRAAQGGKPREGAENWGTIGQ